MIMLIGFEFCIYLAEKAWRNRNDFVDVGNHPVIEIKKLVLLFLPMRKWAHILQNIYLLPYATKTL